MKKLVVYIILVFSVFGAKCQDAYYLDGSQYVFQKDGDEIKWMYEVKATLYNYNSYYTKITASFYTKEDVHLFDLNNDCSNVYTSTLIDKAADCYNDTVKMYITVSVWENTNSTCTGTPLKERTKLYILENPFIYGKLQLCKDHLSDTIICEMPNEDVLNLEYTYQRYEDLYINTYSENSFPGNTKFVYPVENYCIGDSVWINFRTGSGESYKIYKQYNNNEPVPLSEEDVIPILDLSGQDDSLCSYSHFVYYNHFSYRTTADTINDTLFSDNNKFTRITYYVSIQTSCGQDSFFTVSKPIYVYKPLKFIPYTLFHNCLNDASGSITFDLLNRYGGYILHNFIYHQIYDELHGYGEQWCDSAFLNLVNRFSYVLYRDNIFNDTYDELCYDLYGQGNLTLENNSVQGLAEGDYKIIISPNKIDCEELSTSDEYSNQLMSYNNLCCRKKTNCTGNPISFTFTIKKFNHAKPLGDDRILCQDSTVILSIPESYTTDGNNAVWGTAFCGTNSEVSEGNLHQRKVINGGGGYHTVTITTTEGCLIKDTVIVADLKPNTLNYQLPTALMTNAVKYSSGWPTQFNTIQWEDKEQLEYFEDANIFFNGIAGIFRPSKSYDYADSLNSSANLIRSDASAQPVTELNDVNIRNTGNIIDYKLFNYGNPLFSDCVPQWVFNNQMTKYSPSGYDIENKDILNIHSSALYGYRDKLPIAVCSNAKMDEIGFESFEEYTTETYDSITQLTNSTGNIDIVIKTDTLLMPKYRQYDVVRAFNRYAMIKGNICSACDEPFKAFVAAQSVPYDFTTEKIVDLNITSYQTKVMASPCGDSSYTILRLDEGLPSDQMAFKCSFWAGTISSLIKKRIPLLGPFNLVLDDAIAHTGNYSLQLPANERIIIPQFDLELIPRKSYHIGAWVHHSDMYTLSPENLKYTNQKDSIGILLILPNNEKVFAFPSGEVINGWQRVEGTFTMPPGMRTEVQLGFVGKQSFNIDDIRIFPQNSAIQTYIYDPQNYKVRAVLDQNNYATIYQYDDEGNLFAIKKETIKGIKTIQVSNSHIKSSKP